MLSGQLRITTNFVCLPIITISQTRKLSTVMLILINLQEWHGIGTKERGGTNKMAAGLSIKPNNCYIGNRFGMHIQLLMFSILLNNVVSGNIRYNLTLIKY